MKNYIAVFALLGLFACTSETKKEETTDDSVAKIETREDLIVNENGHFTEYYPGKKQIKMEGYFDDAQERHGIWKWHTESGITISVTEFVHGEKNGLSLVYFANGKLNYQGEYKDDKPVGIWTTYDEKTGKIITEKDYGIGE